MIILPLLYGKTVIDNIIFFRGAETSDSLIAPWLHISNREDGYDATIALLLPPNHGAVIAIVVLFSSRCNYVLPICYYVFIPYAQD